MPDKIGRGRSIGGYLLVLFGLFLVGCYLAYRRGISLSEVFRRFLDAIGL